MLSDNLGKMVHMDGRAVVNTRIRRAYQHNNVQYILLRQCNGNLFEVDARDAF